MIDTKGTKGEKLKSARKMFMRCIDHYDKIQKEWHRSSRFYDNTRSVGQWEADDLDYLQSQSRPAFTFNLIKAKIDTVLGIYKDAKRKAIVEAVGGEDAFTAEILNSLVDRLRDHVGAGSVDSEVLKTGLVKGEGNCIIDAERDPKNPAGIKLILKWVSPHDVHWDPGSQKADRSDARFVFVDRWLSKGEFAREYPDHSEKFDEWLRSNATATFFGDDSDSGVEGDSFQKSDDYSDEDGTATYYFDRHRGKIRVVHCEYLNPVKEGHLLDNKSQQSHSLSDKAAKAAEKMIADGQMSDVEVIYTWRDVCYQMDFVHGEILFEMEEPLPIDGFSITPFTCFLDQEDGVPYGLVRNQIDAQQEVNKAHSEAVEFLVGQGKTGVLAEAGTIEDVETFEEQLQTTGTVAIVERNALVEKRIMPRQVPQFSQAATQRLQDGILMLDRIAGISSDLEQPAAHAEAAVTVQLRYHKSRLALTEVFQNYETYQRQVLGKIVRLIVGIMPSPQIVELLGNDQKYQANEIGVTELKQDPLGEGPPTPGRVASIMDLRSLRYDIQLENTSDNTSLRLMELESLSKLAQLGVPIDPVLLVEKAISNRADRERLSEFASSSSAMQSKMENDQREREAQQTESAIQVEAQRQQEDARHNMMDETIKAEKVATEYRSRIAAVYERGDSSEKANMLKWLTEITKQQNQLAGGGGQS